MKQNVLMIFCDKSGSMAGEAFKVMQERMESLASTIFGETVDSNLFSEVHTVYYDEDISARVTNTKVDYLAKVRSESPGSATDFIKCFEYIEK